MNSTNNSRPEKLKGTLLKKFQQKNKILNLLYMNGPLSGTSISKQIGVSLPTAFSLLNELQESKYIITNGTGKSRGGRKPTLFGLAGDSIYIIACEVERFNAKIIIYNSLNHPITPLFKFKTSIDDNKLAEKIYQSVQQLVKENNIDEDKILGIGVTMPGLVDEKEGINHTIKDESFRNIKKRLEEKFKFLVYINNDARMQAYGEYIFGAAKGYENAIVITWSWGIGMGMIIDGKLYNGSTGYSGEFSHIQVAENGNLCICGKRGCLETVASAYVLVNGAIREINKESISQLTQQFKGRTDDLTPEDIILAAKSGDELSIHLLEQVSLKLGKGLSIILQLLNPGIIVIGGPISVGNQFILTPIQQSLNKFCLEQINDNTKIVISNTWEQSGLLGVTAKIFQKLFSDIRNL
ncbi:MAG: ROK family transcriptional regulator [Porphyromonadaceae bacterium]|nr:ROK family transcriptional regulator [Porphyromonadaceae bacterium]